MIAAFWGDHTDHDASLSVFAGANRHTGACSIHSLAEVYATTYERGKKKLNYAQHLPWRQRLRGRTAPSHG